MTHLESHGRRWRFASSLLAAVLLMLAGGLHAPVAAQENSGAKSEPTSGPGVRVTGTVSNADGAPMAGARVLLLPRGVVIDPPKFHEATSAEDGSFAFDGVPPAGEYRVWAIAGNASSRERRFQGEVVKVDKDAPPGTPVPPIKLVLRPGRTMKVTVTSDDDGGKPLAGASVRLILADTGVRDYATGADGTVIIEALTAEPWQVEATAPGKAKVRKTVNLAGGDSGSAVEFALGAGGSLFGKVVGPDGKPAAGVGVSVREPRDVLQSNYVTTDAAGAYRVDGVPVGREMSVRFGGKSLADRFDTITLPAKAGSEHELNVTLAARVTGSVTGIVLDADEKPIEGASVIYQGPSSNDRQTAKTDAAGAFRIDGIDMDRSFGRRLDVRVKGFAPHVVNMTPGTPENPGTVTVRVTEPGHTIKGRVVDEKGRPVAGAGVYAGGRGVFEPGTQRTSAGPDGRFAFDSLPADVRFDVTARGFTRVDGAKLALDGEAEVEVVLPALGAIVGRVTDADSGEPVKRFNVKLRWSPGRGNSRVALPTSRMREGEEFGGGDGTFRLDELPTSTALALEISADGYPPQFFDDITPAPAGEDKPVEIKLAKSPAGYVRLAGKVLGGDGKPAANVELRAIAYGPAVTQRERVLRFNWRMVESGQLAMQPYVRSIASAKSGADGSFAFAPLPGDHGVDLAYWGAGVPQTLRQDIDKLSPEDAGRLELRGPTPGSVAGRLDRKSFPHIEHIEVQSVTDNTFRREVKVKDGDERYTIADLPPGSYRIFVAGEAVPSGGETFFFPRIGQAEVQVAEGERRELDLGFTPGRVVTGQLSSAGKPLADRHVSLYAEGGRVGSSVQLVARTDAEGRFRFPHVPPGKYAMLPLATDMLENMKARRAPDRRIVEVGDADLEMNLELADPKGL